MARSMRFWHSTLRIAVLSELTLGNDAVYKSQFTAILRVLCQNRIDLVISNEL